MNTVLDLEQTANHPTEFLNSLEPSDVPPHRLLLKVGCVIILLRNLNPPKLSNGTRLTVGNLFYNVIEATILTGASKG